MLLRLSTKIFWLEILKSNRKYFEDSKNDKVCKRDMAYIIRLSAFVVNIREKQEKMEL